MTESQTVLRVCRVWNQTCGLLCILQCNSFLLLSPPLNHSWHISVFHILFSTGNLFSSCFHICLEPSNPTVSIVNICPSLVVWISATQLVGPLASVLVSGVFGMLVLCFQFWLWLSESTNKLSAFTWYHQNLLKSNGSVLSLAVQCWSGYKGYPGIAQGLSWAVSGDIQGNAWICIWCWGFNLGLCTCKAYVLHALNSVIVLLFRY